MDIIQDLKWRYAVKKFDTNKLLSEENVTKLKTAFNLTATSYGLQPIKMVVLKNKELQQKLVPFSWNQKQVAQASHLLILCTVKKIDTDYITTYFERVKSVRATSDEVLAPFRENLITNFSSTTGAELENWAKNQAYLAMGNLLTVCAVEKIDSCPMEGFQTEAYDKLLGLSAQGLTSVLVMPVGYRDQNDMFSEFKKVRKNLNESIIEVF